MTADAPTGPAATDPIARADMTPLDRSPIGARTRIGGNAPTIVQIVQIRAMIVSTGDIVGSSATAARRARADTIAVNVMTEVSIATDSVRIGVTTIAEIGVMATGTGTATGDARTGMTAPRGGATVSTARGAGASIALRAVASDSIAVEAGVGTTAVKEAMIVSRDAGMNAADSSDPTTANTRTSRRPMNTCLRTPMNRRSRRAYPPMNSMRRRREPWPPCPARTRTSSPGTW